MSRLDESTLKEIASESGGEYLRGANDRDELDIIYNDLAKIKKTELGEKRVTDYEDRFYYFLATAIILLLGEFFMTERRSRLLDRMNKALGIDR